MGKLSLEEFAAANPRYSKGSAAWLTTIPEWDTVRAAWCENRANGTQIREWLVKECGYPEDEVTYARTGGFLSKTFPKSRRG